MYNDNGYLQTLPSPITDNVAEKQTVKFANGDTFKLPTIPCDTGGQKFFVVDPLAFQPESDVLKSFENICFVTSNPDFDPNFPSITTAYFTLKDGDAFNLTEFCNFLQQNIYNFKNINVGVCENTFGPIDSHNYDDGNSYVIVPNTEVGGPRASLNEKGEVQLQTQKNIFIITTDPATVEFQQFVDIARLFIVDSNSIPQYQFENQIKDVPFPYPTTGEVGAGVGLIAGYILLGFALLNGIPFIAEKIGSATSKISFKKKKGEEEKAEE